MFKHCNFCLVEYPATLDHFHKSVTGKYGLSGKCKSCYRQYREANKELIREKDRLYAENNRESIAKKRKEYRQGNKESLKEWSKRYYVQNKEEILAKQKEYADENKDKVSLKGLKWREKNEARVLAYVRENKEILSYKRREWAKRNKDTIRGYSQVRRAKRRNLESRLTVAQWDKIKSDFQHKCAYCGEEKELVQEHFLALTLGGEYSVNNIIPACTSCNSSKNKKDFFKWYPAFKHYSRDREKFIVKYLNYHKDGQQLAIDF